MTRYAILLRGLTPSGRNRVPMAALRAALAEAGLADVRTYIQSGNVIARSALDRHTVESLVHEVVRREIGADLSPDEVRVVGATIYTLYATKHSDSKVDNNFLERALGVAATTRNFNTLSRLLALSA